MRKVFLHGELGNSLGKEWDLEVGSVQEALWAIEANTNKLTSFLRKNTKRFPHYTFTIDNKKLDKHQLESPIGDGNKDIHIMPRVAGGDPVNILIFIVVSIVTSLIISAIFKPPKPKEAVATNSYLFGGTQNVAAQGVPVPLGYGRLRVGSVVVSAAVRHVEYTSKSVAKNEPIRLGTYDPKNPSGGGQPGVFLFHGAGPGGLGTLNENDIEYDENGKPFIPDYKLGGDSWDDDPFGDNWDDDWCWVAREVYGVNNSKWLLFRHWLLNYSPNWFCNWYKQNGKMAAKWLSKNNWLKPVIRRWMNGRIQSLQKNIK